MLSLRQGQVLMPAVKHQKYSIVDEITAIKIFLAIVDDLKNSYNASAKAISFIYTAY